MRISVDIGHPAQVHLFKHFIWEMEKRGHEILITASQKDISLQLLDAYGFDYINMGSYGHSILRKIVQIPAMDLKMYRAVKDFCPDIFVGTASARGAHVAKMLGKPSITLQDTEPGVYQDQLLYGALTDVYLTPVSFGKDLGKKQIRYNGYHELAYLHPNYYTPNPAFLDEINLKEGERYSVVRFVGWGSPVEVGKRGILNKMEVVKELEKYGRVFITAEGKLVDKLEKYRVDIPPDKVHDLLYYADLLFCDSQTMATEAAILGTPVVRCNSFVGGNDMGNFKELEKKYNLVLNCESEEKALNTTVNILNMANMKDKWAKRCENLLKEKIDVTSFMVWFIENYPQSFAEIKEHPEIQYKFR